MPTFEFPEDELTTGANTPATNASTPNPTPFSFAAEPLDWDDDALLTLTDGLDRIKPAAGKLVRFALVPGLRPLSNHIHFAAINGKPARSYICGRANCPLCKSGVRVEINVVAMAVHYTDADDVTGRAPESHDKYRIGYVLMSGSAYDKVKKAPPGGLKPSQVDYLADFDGNQYSFHAAISPPQFLRLGDSAVVTAMAAPLVSKLESKLGSVIPANAANGTVPPGHGAGVPF